MQKSVRASCIVAQNPDFGSIGDFSCRDCNQNVYQQRDGGKPCNQPSLAPVEDAVRDLVNGINGIESVEETP